MKLLTSLVTLAVLGAAAALATVYLGLPEIAATTPHWKLTEWALSTAMENGVRRRAAGIAVPHDLDAPERIHNGASDYAEMCAGCHAAPGVESAELAKGLLPAPPELAEEAGGWSPAELFWIVEHGVRMTGMPAFGPTHSDRKIWNMVAFLRRLPGMSATTYHTLADHPGEEHQHDNVEH